MRFLLVAMSVAERLEHLRPHERHVADEDHHVARRVLFQLRLAHPRGVARAEPLGLLDERDPLLVRVLRDHLFLAEPDDEQHAIATRLPARAQDVIEHRPSTDLVQHLRPARLHPRGLPRGEDDGSGGHQSGARSQKPGARRNAEHSASPTGFWLLATGFTP